LSSVSQPIEEMGREIARLVVEMSEAGVMESQQLILKPALSVPESTCRARDQTPAMV
jgi:DNA-binding LacI/PurR family transcriptional regulator